MDTNEAIGLIRELIQDADHVRADTVPFDSWRHKCQVVLDLVFGEDSKQLKNLFGVNFEYHGISWISDNTPHIRAFETGIQTSKDMLKTFIWQIERFGVPAPAKIDKPAIEIVEHICSKFHEVARQLRKRHDNRPTLDVENEYDVQDLLHALLRLHFDDIRDEEWAPSYAGKSTRMDFLLKAEQIVVETKMTRKGLDRKKLGSELIEDIAHYRNHQDCRALICFVYDPEGRISNSAGLRKDLETESEEFTVKVVIAP